MRELKVRFLKLISVVKPQILGIRIIKLNTMTLQAWAIVSLNSMAIFTYGRLRFKLHSNKITTKALLSGLVTDYVENMVLRYR